MRERAVDVGSVFGAVAGSVASAAAALCCVGPLALTLLGVNGMILAAGIKPYPHVEDAHADQYDRPWPQFDVDRLAEIIGELLNAG